MRLKTIDEKENPLFKRKEVKCVLECPSIPSRSNIINFLSEKFSIPKENIKIRKISGRFGTNLVDVEAALYSCKEEKKRLEILKKKERG
ncbi:MAG: hypothetical protein QXU40_01315 [Candidatus Pacearchaeota archaeon]